MLVDNIDNQNSQSQLGVTKHQHSTFLLNKSQSFNQLKSLHMPLKRREAQRIDDENAKMIDRIMNTNSTHPLKKLQDDFKQHLKFKKIIQKNKPMPVE